LFAGFDIFGVEHTPLADEQTIFNIHTHFLSEK
jgi:hypothetical protein